MANPAKDPERSRKADEEGEATATVPGTLAATGTYHVYVDGSGEEDVVAACGDLSRV